MMVDTAASDVFELPRDEVGCDMGILFSACLLPVQLLFNITKFMRKANLSNSIIDANIFVYMIFLFYLCSTKTKHYGNH